ncbi:Uncharacterised protein [Burkholderia pseudomallei]|nr:Uncharacterised protein [Burkholderia pseudomallei]CAJ4437694.1 Uncharacterised protein [Burkholderia pseudomallei]CAJ4919228.1 Uncharacterised protein [Burkholderia pseudomallei]CAK0262251.1 Uncharacterised protein [Burkholderia pseudomallei]
MQPLACCIVRTATLSCSLRGNCVGRPAVQGLRCNGKSGLQFLHCCTGLRQQYEMRLWDLLDDSTQAFCRDSMCIVNKNSRIDFFRLKTKPDSSQHVGAGRAWQQDSTERPAFLAKEAPRQFAGERYRNGGPGCIAHIKVSERGRTVQRGLRGPHCFSGTRKAYDDPHACVGRQCGFCLLRPIVRGQSRKILKLYGQLFKEVLQLPGPKSMVDSRGNPCRSCHRQSRQFPNEGFRSKRTERQSCCYCGASR